MIRLAHGIAEKLKSNPLALVLVVVNVLFLIVAAYTLREISASTERKDQLLSELAKDCIVSPKGDRLKP